jgi:RNA polymerase sigma-70 factor, ECF subfamily
VLRNRDISEPLYVKIAVDSQLVEALPVKGHGAPQMPERSEDVVRIQAAIRKLPLPFQEILMLREFEELPYQDVAMYLTVLRAP